MLDSTMPPVSNKEVETNFLNLISCPFTPAHPINLITKEKKVNKREEEKEEKKLVPWV